jgi:hypothetical protein
VEISDQDALEAVAFGVIAPWYAFVVNGVRLDGEDLNLEIVDRLTSVRLRVALPRTGRDEHWIYVEPDDAADWASQLFVWIEEEVGTGGMRESRVREIETREGRSESYVIAEPYGWRLSNPDEHARLLRAMGGND